MSTDELAGTIRTALAAEADPERAPAQQAYMKSTMPFLGIPVPRVRRITVDAVRGVRDPGALQRAASDLWDRATHREHWYAAMTLLARTPNRGRAEVIPIAEHMIRTGRWWDVTDDLAHRLAEQLDVRPEETADLLRRWARDPELWIRRVAIIAQLGRRDRVDVPLLTEAILENANDPDFFIRKAIGWALRDHARTDPDGVRRFVEEHSLSPLSEREAMKHLR